MHSLSDTSTPPQGGKIHNALLESTKWRLIFKLLLQSIGVHLKTLIPLKEISAKEHTKEQGIGSMVLFYINQEIHKRCQFLIFSITGDIGTKQKIQSKICEKMLEGTKTPSVPEGLRQRMLFPNLKISVNPLSGEGKIII